MPGRASAQGLQTLLERRVDVLTGASVRPARERILAESGEASSDLERRTPKRPHFPKHALAHRFERPSVSATSVRPKLRDQDDGGLDSV